MESGTSPLLLPAGAYDNTIVSFYPAKVSERFYALKRRGKSAHADAVGTGASFVCGSFVRFYLEIDAARKSIRAARFQSNGCGYALAAADALAERIAGRRLTDLHGAETAALLGELETELEPFPDERRHCLSLCLDALRQAFADYRARQIEEFTGERALVCTCFGVSEETIERLIANEAAATVEQVGRACHAGTGCGSCRFLIQELIDVHESEN